MSRRLVDGKLPKPKKGANPGGVPSIIELDQELSKKILNSVRMGNYIAVAARQFGVHPRTIHTWIAKGLEDPKSLYGAFSRQLDQALAEAEARDLAALDSHANGRPRVYERDKTGNIVMDKKGNPIVLQEEVKSDWKATAWKLERRAKRRWGVTDLAQSASEQEMPSAGARDVTPEQKGEALNEVREVIAALDELESDE